MKTHSHLLCAYTMTSMSNHQVWKKHQGAIRSPFDFSQNIKPFIVDFQKNWSISVNEFQ